MSVTLLEKGKIHIKPHYTQYDIDFINSRPAKDFILRWLANRVPAHKGGIPNIRPSGPADKIMIIRADTGSGKSGTFAPELYLAFYEIFRKNIAVTQPRVLTAETIPLDIVSFPAYSAKIHMGQEIGYMTGDNKYKPENGGIIFMTAGVLSQQLKTMADEDFMLLYSFIIIDECHDRGTDNYLVLSMIKGLIHRNWNNSECPFVILTSATFDHDHYARWIGVDPKDVISVKGFNYPIQDTFLKVPCADMHMASVAKAMEIHLANPDDYAKPNSRETDIIIFVPGISSIKNIRKALEELNEKNAPGHHFIVISLTGESFKVGDADYQSIYKPLASLRVKLKGGEVVPQRRIIISTDVAETGVTIDTLKYLIDTGFVKDSVYDPIYGVEGLLLKNVSQASAVQRRGRVGRRFPGYWYPLYTKDTFGRFPLDKLADLLTSKIGGVLLGIIIKKVHPIWNNKFAELTLPHDAQISLLNPAAFKIEDIDMLDPVPSDNIYTSLERLYALGMLNPDMSPTAIGLIANAVMMVPLEAVRMILAGYQHGVKIMDLITMAAFLTTTRDRGDYLERNKKTRSPFPYLPKLSEDIKVGGKQKKAKPARREQSRIEVLARLFIEDDFIEPLFVWDEFCSQMAESRKSEDIAAWAAARHINLSAIFKASAVRDNLIDTFVCVFGLDVHKWPRPPLLDVLNDDVSAGIEEIRKIKRCILDGYRPNVLQWDEKQGAYVLRCGRPVSFGQNLRDFRLHSDIKSFQQFRPSTIIASEVRLAMNEQKTGYKLEISRVSPLDLYLGYDEKYLVS